MPWQSAFCPAEVVVTHFHVICDVKVIALYRGRFRVWKVGVHSVEKIEVQKKESVMHRAEADPEFLERMGMGEGGGRYPEAAISWVEMYSQHAKHGRTRGAWGHAPPQENFKNRC